MNILISENLYCGLLGYDTTILLAVITQMETIWSTIPWLCAYIWVSPNLYGSVYTKREEKQESHLLMNGWWWICVVGVTVWWKVIRNVIEPKCTNENWTNSRSLRGGNKNWHIITCVIEPEKQFIKNWNRCTFVLFLKSYFNNNNNTLYFVIFWACCACCGNIMLKFEVQYRFDTCTWDVCNLFYVLQFILDFVTLYSALCTKSLFLFFYFYCLNTFVFV
jgi:hypothetical protein